jgi:hypothetical protein
MRGVHSNLPTDFIRGLVELSAEFLALFVQQETL